MSPTRSGTHCPLSTLQRGPHSPSRPIRARPTQASAPQAPRTSRQPLHRVHGGRSPEPRSKDEGIVSGPKGGPPPARGTRLSPGGPEPGVHVQPEIHPPQLLNHIANEGEISRCRVTPSGRCRLHRIGMTRRSEFSLNGDPAPPRRIRVPEDGPTGFEAGKCLPQSALERSRGGIDGSPGDSELHPEAMRTSSPAGRGPRAGSERESGERTFH